MLEQLLSEVRQQIEQSEQPVKAAALLHLARVLTAFDRGDAERVLERGIDLAFDLAATPGDPLRSQAVTIAASVSPQRAIRLLPLLRDPMHRRAEGIVFSMMRHGHIDDAVSWLSEPAPWQDYPFHAAMEAMSRAPNEEARRNILRAAIRARLSQSASTSMGFDMLFAHRWNVLPAEEATAAVRDIVRRTIEEPDAKTESKFSNGRKTARLSSTREARLFEIFGAVSHLDAALADSLCNENTQLAAAVRAFPRGYHAHMTAPPEEDPAEKSEEHCEQPDYITVGTSRLLPIPEALKTEFRESFHEALRLYARDTDPTHPNESPREFWPSAMEFRNILYKAGQHEGHAAARYLVRIPDRDLRLFAQIELIAGVAGLPQFGGISIPPRPRPTDKKHRWIT